MKLIDDAHFSGDGHRIKISDIDFGLGIQFKTIKKYNLPDGVNDSVAYYNKMLFRFINNFELQNKIKLSIIEASYLPKKDSYVINFSGMFLDYPRLPGAQFQVHFKSYNYPKISKFSFQKTSSEEQWKLLNIALQNILFVDKHDNPEVHP
jgi:hypothetical protein